MAPLRINGRLLCAIEGAISFLNVNVVGKVLSEFKVNIEVHDLKLGGGACRVQCESDSASIASRRRCRGPLPARPGFAFSRRGGRGDGCGPARRVRGIRRSEGRLARCQPSIYFIIRLVAVNVATVRRRRTTMAYVAFIPTSMYLSTDE